MENMIAYVLENPVKAGLSSTAAEWAWSGGKLRDLAFGQACLGASALAGL